MGPRASHLAAVAGAAAALGAAGCGAADDGPDVGAGAAVAGPAVGREGFPAVDGGALGDVLDDVPLALRATPRTDAADAASSHRSLSFVLRDRAGTPLQDARAAVYVARPDGRGARGPFAARTRAVASVPPGASDGARLSAATSEYVARVPAPEGRRMLVAALVEVDGRLLAAAPYLSRRGRP